EEVRKRKGRGKEEERKRKGRSEEEERKKRGRGKEEERKEIDEFLNTLSALGRFHVIQALLQITTTTTIYI
ncbi:hypothetical protein BpHYR1_054465, partial [Brachionus plicatilis]